MTTSAVAAICGVPMEQVDAWCRRGLVRSVVPAGGTARHRLFSPSQVLAVAVGRYLRRELRVPLATAAAFMAALHELNEDELAHSFAAGRTHMAVSGSLATVLTHHHLVPADAVAVVNVAECYRKIVESLDRVVEPAVT